MWYIWVSLLFVSHAVDQGAGQAIRRSLFEEPCHGILKCDKSAWLACRESKCVCKLEDSMVWDAARSKCVSKTGERCRFQVSSETGGTGTGEDNERTLYEHSDCVGNARCNSGFTCECLEGFFETMNGTCEKQGEQGKQCSSDAECDLRKLLSCKNGTCQCTSSNNVFALPNIEAWPFKACVGRADATPVGTRNCVTGAILQNGFCRCNSTVKFFSGQDGLCHRRKTINQPCMADKECIWDGQYLNCINDYCQCPMGTKFRQFSTTITVISEEVQVYSRIERNPLDTSDENSEVLNPRFSNESAYFLANNSNIVIHGKPIERPTNDGRYIWILAKLEANRSTHLSQCVGISSQSCNPESFCVENSSCSAVSKLCGCDPPSIYYEAEDGLCYAKKTFDQPCQNDEQCLWERHFLKCLYGKCLCPSGTTYREFQKKSQTFDLLEMQVLSHNQVQPSRSELYRYKVLNPEGDISPYNDLFRTTEDDNYVVFGKKETSNQYYHRRHRNVPTRITAQFSKGQENLTQCVGLALQICNPESNCISDASCSNSAICTCNIGFSVTSAGACGRGYGASCNPSGPCSDAFKCTNFKCNCPYPKHQVYNEGNSKCLGMVWSYCSNGSDCLPNLSCMLNPDSLVKQCQCDNGYLENSNGTCDIAWNTTCSYGRPSCDTIAGLQCRNGLCACPDDMDFYNSTSRSCQGLVGSRCSKYNSTCVGGASCVGGNPRITGRCLCQQTHKPNQNNLCSPVILTALPAIENTTQAGVDVAVTALPAIENTTKPGVDEAADSAEPRYTFKCKLSNK